jgi:hypothetical protein
MCLWLAAAAATEIGQFACGAGACCPVVAAASKLNAAALLAFVFVSGQPCCS